MPLETYKISPASAAELELSSSASAFPSEVIEIIGF